MNKMSTTTVRTGALLATLLFASAGFASTISLDPASQIVAQGSLATFNVMVSGLGNGSSPALGAYDLIFNFDPTILSLSSVAFSSRLGDATDPTQTQVLPVNLVTPGAVEIVETSFLSAAQLFALQTSPTGDFGVATLTFNTIGTGNTTITPELPSGGLSDENGNDLTPSFTVVSSSLLITGSPEPATIPLLFAGGLILFALGVRRRKQA